MANEVLVPPEDWVIDPDPDYDNCCPTCSALVEERAVHRAFHLAIVELAERYVHPPNHGGIA